MKKLFAFDLDGTLLNSKSELSQENCEAIKIAKAKGHIIVAATGRNYIYTDLVLKDHWDLFDYYIGCNGAIVHDLTAKKSEIQGNNLVPFGFVKTIIDELKPINGTIQVSTKWGVFTEIYVDEKEPLNHFIKQSVKEQLFDPFPKLSQMNEEDKNSIVGFSVHLKEEDVRPTWKKWEKEFGDDFEFTITSKNNIDVNTKGMSKLTSLKEIIRLENISNDNVYIFGDSQNDIRGLSYFKNSYAMGNAFDEVKEAAKHTIGNNDTNAIATIIIKNV